MANVLIVDDSRTSRRILRDLVESGGNKIVGEAVNGREAIDMYTALKPDVVTMDITMPIMDGTTALAEILDMDPEARVIMVSAVGQRSKIVECIKMGAKDYIIKPYELRQVIEVIDKCLV